MSDKESTLRIIGEELEKTLDQVADEPVGGTYLKQLIADLLRRAYEAGHAARAPVDRHDLARLRALCEAATPAPWVPAQFPESAGPAARHYFEELLSYGSGEVFGAVVPIDGVPLSESALWTVITGNGPTSEANAALAIAARAALPDLLDAAERLLAIDGALETVRLDIEEKAYADEDWLNVGMVVWPDFVSDDEPEEVTQERPA